MDGGSIAGDTTTICYVCRENPDDDDEFENDDDTLRRCLSCSRNFHENCVKNPKYMQWKKKYIDRCSLKKASARLCGEIVVSCLALLFICMMWSDNVRIFTLQAYAS